jgi:hypothetical protein
MMTASMMLFAVDVLSTLHTGPVQGRLFVAGVTGNTGTAAAAAAVAGRFCCFFSKTSLHFLLALYLKCAEK